MWRNRSDPRRSWPTCWQKMDCCSFLCTLPAVTVHLVVEDLTTTAYFRQTRLHAECFNITIKARLQHHFAELRTAGAGKYNQWCLHKMHKSIARRARRPLSHSGLVSPQVQQRSPSSVIIDDILNPQELISFSTDSFNNWISPKNKRTPNRILPGPSTIAASTELPEVCCNSIWGNTSYWHNSSPSDWINTHIKRTFNKFSEIPAAPSTFLRHAPVFHNDVLKLFLTDTADSAEICQIFSDNGQSTTIKLGLPELNGRSKIWCSE